MQCGWSIACVCVLCGMFSPLVYLMMQWCVAAYQLPEDPGGFKQKPLYYSVSYDFWGSGIEAKLSKQGWVFCWYWRTTWEYSAGRWTGLESLKQSLSDDTLRRGWLEGWPQLRLSTGVPTCGLSSISVSGNGHRWGTDQGSHRWFQGSQADAASLMT